MKSFWSYSRFPELAEYGPVDKVVIWVQFSLWQGGKEAKSWDRFMPMIIVSSGLIGAVLGALNSADPHRGSSWGFGVGLVLSVPLIYVSYVIWLNGRRKVLQRYVQTDEYRNMREKILKAQELAPFIATGFNGTEPPPADLKLDLNIFELAIGPAPPIQRLLGLVFSIAHRDQAEKVEFSLLKASSNQGLQITYSVKGITHQMAPAGGFLFASVAAALCSYASVNYYPGGPVRGKIRTQEPASTWILESSDLKQHVVLLRERKPRQ